MIIGFCNPLLDISAHVSREYLDKHGLKENDAILAKPEHADILQELKAMNLELLYSAGGAGQNAMRACQWLLPPQSVHYMGAVGSDSNAAILEEAANKAGLSCHYMTVPEMQTGTCVCLLTPGHRSLVADLQAAVKFDASHIEMKRYIMEKARAYYLSGFLLSDSFSVAEAVSSIASADNTKTLYVNLSAPFVCQFFLERLKTVLKSCKVLFGNESEARALAISASFPNAETASIQELVPLLARFTTTDNAPRTVVITQGPDSTVYFDPLNECTCTVEVPKMKPEDIVDTNGAGDAFVGGFLAAHLTGKSLKECVDIGHTVAQIVITQSGVVFPDHLRPSI